jgi:hypothetical protein
MSNIETKIRENLYWVAIVIVGAMSVASLFYGIATRVAVLEVKVAEVEMQTKILTQINERLARIEGRFNIK